MENASLSDALISLIPTYGPWIIFGIVALENAGVPLPGETVQAALRVALSRADHLFQLSNLSLPGRYLLAADRSWRKAAVRGIGAFARPRRKPNHDSRTVHFGCK